MKITSLLRASLLLCTPSLLSAAAFTPGNLVLMRVGDGSATIGNTATAVYLDEYTVAGTLVQTVSVPSSGSTALTVSGSATAEGLMTRSQDGKRIYFAGYRKDAGGTSPVSDTPAVTNRVVAFVGADGVVDTSTAVTDATRNFRNAVAATPTGPLYFATPDGVRYAASPGASITSTLIDTRNTRQVLVDGNILYASNGTTLLAKIQSYGTLPTAATTPSVAISLASGDAVQGFWLADLSDTVAGSDTIYLATDLANSADNVILKYSLVGGVWTASGAITATGALNLTGITSAGSPERTANLFYTTTAATSGQLSSVTDNSGYNGTITASPTPLVTVGTNKAFRGISAVPDGLSPTYQFAGATFPGADVQLTWTGTPGAPPVIQYSENLSGWNPLGTTTEAPAGTYTILDTTTMGANRRFYRIAP